MERLVESHSEEFRRLDSGSRAGDQQSQRDALRDQLAADTEAFLANGGRVIEYGTRIGDPAEPKDTWFMAGRLEMNPWAREYRRSRGENPETPVGS